MIKSALEGTDRHGRYLFNFNTCQDLALLEIGDQQCSPLYAFGPNIRNEYIFHYVVSGKGCGYASALQRKRTEYSLRNVEVNAGEGFLLEPHTAHMYRADENDPWHYIWIVFTGLSVPSYLRACGLTRNNPVFRPKSYAHAVSSRVREPLRQILGRPDASKRSLSAAASFL